MTKREQMMRDYALWFWRDRQFHNNRIRYPGIQWDWVMQEIKKQEQKQNRWPDEVMNHEK